MGKEMAKFENQMLTDHHGILLGEILLQGTNECLLAHSFDGMLQEVGEDTRHTLKRGRTIGKFRLEKERRERERRRSG